MPDGATLDVDMVCHSRGGLVSRHPGRAAGRARRSARARVRVGRVVFVGTPNAGTTLADADRVGDLIDTYTTVLNLIPSAGARRCCTAIVTVAKLLAVGAAQGLPGLQAMRPGGAFAPGAQRGRPRGDTRYFALASNYAPTRRGCGRCSRTA